MHRHATKGGIGLVVALCVVGCQKEGVSTIFDSGVSQGGSVAMGGSPGTGGAVPGTGGEWAAGGVTGQGGSQVGVGGALGTGGLLASGGSTGTGGGVGAGGANHAGGMFATGGAGGRGGVSGGSGGTAGSALGGSLGGSGGSSTASGGAGGIRGGSGGSSGDGGQQIDAGLSCGELATRYADALPAARSCNVNATAQCQQLVSAALSPCGGCSIYVNDALTLNDIKARWIQAGCNSVVGIVCPAIGCIAPKAGVCALSDGGSGVCNSTSVIVLTPTGT